MPAAKKPPTAPDPKVISRILTFRRTGIVPSNQVLKVQLHQEKDATPNSHGWVHKEEGRDFAAWMASGMERALSSTFDPEKRASNDDLLGFFAAALITVSGLRGHPSHKIADLPENQGHVLGFTIAPGPRKPSRDEIRAADALEAFLVEFCVGLKAKLGERVVLVKAPSRAIFSGSAFEGVETAPPSPLPPGLLGETPEPLKIAGLSPFEMGSFEERPPGWAFVGIVSAGVGSPVAASIRFVGEECKRATSPEGPGPKTVEKMKEHFNSQEMKVLALATRTFQRHLDQSGGQGFDESSREMLSAIERAVVQLREQSKQAIDDTYIVTKQKPESKTMKLVEHGAWIAAGVFGAKVLWETFKGVPVGGKIVPKEAVVVGMEQAPVLAGENVAVAPSNGSNATVGNGNLSNNAPVGGVHVHVHNNMKGKTGRRPVVRDEELGDEEVSLDSFDPDFERPQLTAREERNLTPARRAFRKAMTRGSF